MRIQTFVAATAFSALGGIAVAQDTGDITVGAGLSNFGVNLEAAYQINPQFRARGAIMGGFSTDFDDDIEGDDATGEFTLGGAALLADYYPLEGGWRVSGGLFISNTELTADGSFDVGDPPVSESASFTAKFENEIAPMITTGYDWGFADSWALSVEAGVIFAGGISVEFDSDSSAAQDEFDNDDDIQDAIDDAADINALPYLSIGVSYRY